jgi:hypothetical protein
MFVKSRAHKIVRLIFEYEMSWRNGWFQMIFVAGSNLSVRRRGGEFFN